MFWWLADYLEKDHLFRLKFRGLTFEFKIDPRLEVNAPTHSMMLKFSWLFLGFQPQYKHDLGSLQFNGPPPIVSRMFLYAGNSHEDLKWDLLTCNNYLYHFELVMKVWFACSTFRAPQLPLQCYHGNCYLESLEVLREKNITKGFKFTLASEGGSISTRSQRNAHFSSES